MREHRKRSLSPGVDSIGWLAHAAHGHSAKPGSSLSAEAALRAGCSWAHPDCTNQIVYVQQPKHGLHNCDNVKHMFRFTPIDRPPDLRRLVTIGETIGLFGVFDGHGGARAAEYVKQHLFRSLIKHPKLISDSKAAISDAYEFLKSENNQKGDAGSTASTAILVAGTWRVGGVLAVSRAFGDALFKQYVVADPEIQEEKVDNSLEFLIIESDDDLWDVVTHDEAVAMVKPIDSPEEAAKRLMQEAS
ncbi:hypothetical protein E3N88_09094 [Mikania micrantha]|uniref:protein-serine/threonine phosphatase n=1 Tax=Mikania micrantha TaxID=192012 RepID=A0A5N6PJ20_9ASTR|nr:hypothetical protein E3N88_09094 [Mikania micrantha]